MKHPFARAVLMTPGPVEEGLDERLAGLAMRMHHRTEEFQALYRTVNEGLAWFMETAGPVAMLAASGSGGLEAAVVNFAAPADPVVVVNAGKFGERWVKLCQAFGFTRVTTLDKPYGAAVHPEELRAVVDRVGARVLFATLQETSTGVRHEIDGFGAALAGSDCLLVVDAVSGLGCMPYRMDAWGVDVTVTASQKGLLCPAGLAFVAWGPRAEARRAAGAGPRFYFDLAKYAKNPERAPFTPPATLVAQLDAVLRKFRAVGKQAVLDAVAAAARAALAGGEALGLEPFSAPRDRSPGCTAFKVPAGLDGVRLTKDALAASGVRIAGGQDELKGKILRLGHMGATSPGDLLGAIYGLEAALARQGARVDPGSGVAAAAASLARGAG